MKCDKRKKGKKHAEFKLFVDQNNKDYKRVDKDNQGITYDDRKIMRPITEKKIEALEEAKKKFEQSKKKSKKEKKNERREKQRSRDVEMLSLWKNPNLHRK